MQKSEASAALKNARHRLGLSAEAFAKLVRVQSGRTVRRWEDGTQDIPGPVQALIDVLMVSPEARMYLGLPSDLPDDVVTPAAAPPDAAA